MKHNYCLTAFFLLAVITLLNACRFSGNEDNGKGITISNTDSVKRHIISITEAGALTSNFRKGRVELSRQLKDNLLLESMLNLPNAESFNRDAIASLLNAEGAAGIRIYLGRDSSNAVRLVMVPVDAKGNDIITQLINREAQPGGTTTRAYTISGQAIEVGQRCPQMCGTASPLNQ